MSTILTDEVRQGIDDITLLLPRNPDQADSSMTLAWCLSPELRAYLKQKGIRDAKLLIVITHEFDETSRYLVPLEAGRTHIAFRYSGLNSVWAVAVWDQDGCKTRDYMKRVDGDYKRTVIRSVDPVLEELAQSRRENRSQQMSLEEAIAACAETLGVIDDPAPLQNFVLLSEAKKWEIDREIARLRRESRTLVMGDVEQELADLQGQMAVRIEEQADLRAAYDSRAKNSFPELSMAGLLHTGHSECTGRLDVMIPKTMFARAWRITTWLGTRREWPTPARDNCHLRKRALGEIPLVGVAAVWRLGVALAALVTCIFFMLEIMGLLVLGLRHIPYRWLREPFRHTPIEWFDEAGDSIWLYAKLREGDSPSFYSPQYRVAPRWRLLLHPIILALAAGSIFSLITLAGVTGFAWGAVSLFVLLSLAGLVYSQRRRIRLGATSIRAGINRAERAWMNSRVNHFAKELDTIGCEVVPKHDTANSLALPKTRKVVYVAHAVKSSVCKPFEG